MINEERFAEKFEYKVGDVTAITNDDMVCKDCLYVDMRNPSTCLQYAMKPAKVILGGKCKKFVDENS